MGEKPPKLLELEYFSQVLLKHLCTYELLGTWFKCTSGFIRSGQGWDSVFLGSFPGHANEDYTVGNMDLGNTQ